MYINEMQNGWHENVALCEGILSSVSKDLSSNLMFIIHQNRCSAKTVFFSSVERGFSIEDVYMIIQKYANITRAKFSLTKSYER